MTESSLRPDPDALLLRAHREEDRQRRAKLRVYLGYAPGVGKTFAMLSAARDSRSSGLVVGLAETHGRYDTAALVLGLEMMPRRHVEYRGRKLEEFDLDATLARKPKIVLLDELAHTNAPGSRHNKRWQDVLELLDAGIDVYTTLNIQHIESLNDVVAQITGVRVRETVPDSIFARADEIELIDVPPEELLNRLREGKVYLSEQAARAVDHFFKRGNLLALRELALRRVADRVDLDVLAHRQENSISATWPTQERIVVCVGPAPASQRLVRAAARMSAGLRAPWVAAYVEPTTTAPMTAAAQERLESHLKLAESLGADIARLSGTRVSTALIDYCRRHNVTRIVIGKPTHWRIRDVLRGSVLDEVVRGSGEIDIHVISGDPSPLPPVDDTPERQASPIDWKGSAWATGLVVAATTVSAFGRTPLALPDIVMIYLLVIMIVAVRFSRAASVLAAVLSVAFYDFFFIPPFFTFSVSDVRHTLTFSMMFGVGLVISGLTLRIRRQEHDARSREVQTAALYALSREISAAPDEAAVATAIAQHAAEVFEAGAAVVSVNDSGVPAIAAQFGEVPFGAEEQGVARWVFEHERPAGLGTDTLPGARVMCLPLRGRSRAIAVLALAIRPQSGAFALDRHFRDAYLRQGAMALERSRLAEDAKTSALRARTEEMRSSLLSAVSHDLRTPLAAITGAGTMLRDDAARLGPADRADLVDTICEEAERLERLVGNLLDMTRLESGSLRVKREWVPVEELVISALTRLGHRLEGRDITTDFPRDVPLISVDPVLVEQVFVNLFENAAKYTPPGSPLEIHARNEDDGVEIEIADRGPGLPQGLEGRLFEKFFRGPNAKVGGVGLGLSICRGIVEAHGGTLVAENRPGGGAVFRVTLPKMEGAPVVLAEPDAVEPEAHA
jgi:two-component system sensor histidine kinase KdpD